MSGRTASSVGMMQGAFFVSRSDLLSWVNNLLQVSLTKVEQCASGAVYCQILDSCHPGTVGMRKVNWMARADHEFIPNYKILQAAFDKNSIEKYVDVDKLIRGRYQDNLEFLQWMKCYADHNYSTEPYEASAPREGRPLPPWARSTGGSPGPAQNGRQPLQDKENVQPRNAVLKNAKPNEPEIKKLPLGCRAAPTVRPVGLSGVRMPLKPANGPLSTRGASMGGVDKEATAREDALQRKVEDLEQKLGQSASDNADLRSTLESLEAERDFYFRRLREVEIFCSTLDAHMKSDHLQLDASITPASLVKDVQGILYLQDEGEDRRARSSAGGEGVDVIGC